MRFRCIEVARDPILKIDYENVAPRRMLRTEALPILTARASGFPAGIDAIVATSDLQGHVRSGRELRLLGNHLAGELETLAANGMLPELDRVGVILAGDLFAHPTQDRRGGSGDVRSVWQAFADRCRWVAGVAGNHDTFGPVGSLPDFRRLNRQPNIHLLDGDCIMLDGLRIAGLSGIVGGSARPLRRREAEFAAEVGRLAALGSDIIIMHDGPGDADIELKGWKSVREVLERSRPTLVVRGHRRSRSPLATLGNGAQVLNVHARFVVLRPGAHR